MVRRNLAPSRTRASQLINAGRVSVDGQVASKPARQIDPAQAIVVAETTDPDFASRGGYKLAGALDYLGAAAPHIEGRICLDAGASAGGFTDVLLRHSAAKVYAVDVGYGQLAWRLASDTRVDVRDRTNVRLLTPEDFDPRPSLVVSDLSFISLTLVLAPLVNVCTQQADLIVMVKPQFEIGKDRLGAGGVVRDPADHIATVTRVATCACSLGLTVAHAAPSPLPGPAGNVEYFLHLVKGSATTATSADDLGDMIAAAVKDGPAGGGERL
nr:TlyA family RNA methyltransferase [Nanchangia anserum]